MRSPFLSGVLFASYFLLIAAGKLYYYSDGTPTDITEPQEAAGAGTLMPMLWGARKKMPRSIPSPSPYFYMHQHRAGTEEEPSATRHFHHESRENYHHHYHHHHRHHKQQRHHHHRQHGAPYQHYQNHPTTMTSTTTSPPTTKRVIVHEPFNSNAKLSQLQAVIVQLEQKLNELRREISGTKKPSAATVVDSARSDLNLDETSRQKPTAELKAEHRDDDDDRGLGGQTFVDVDLRIG
uniref:Uncharacterized protein n=1 Tax=Anopheles atroparvus TaxID=41427 RepID=A0A182IKR2_ANOAO